MRSTILCLFLYSLAATAYASDAELATSYRTYGYREGNDWVIPMRIWVHERRGLSEHLIAKVAASLGGHESQETANFRSRIQDFAADSESREAVILQFDNDPESREYRVRDSHGSLLKTDWNGIVEGVVRISTTKAADLLSRQGSRDGWLSYRAISKDHSSTGRVRLLEATGLSVISDIDDTIKTTEIPAGSKIVVTNTFFRDFAAAPGMAEMYQGWSGASFHYVSGGPWQLYAPISEFLLGAAGGFPEGTFHMKNIRKNLFSANSWEDLKELVTNENVTVDQKLSQISEIMRRFPARKFILVGDSGEKDPEVYREIRRRFPHQVQEIKIRDIVNDRERNKSRLEGMTIIVAATVVPGVSQLGN
jgi:hypothetical protein